jgi:glycosyltransferase involved in cell wall biosynthesis
VATVLYGLDAPPTMPDRGAEDEAPTLLVVARLVSQKGIDVLIRAMPSVIEAVPTVTLLVAGEGRDRAKLERLVAELGLESRVNLLGRRKDVQQLMRRAWLLVHPARWEGFGLVILEAMREGLPVVATTSGAIPEIVVEGVTGRLVPPDDVAPLADAVVASLRDESFRREAAHRGHMRLRDHFSPARMARETAAVYERAT